MKKILFLALSALFAISACNGIEENTVPENTQPEVERHLTLDLTVNYLNDDGTKATKTAWSIGDRILMFFNKKTNAACKRAELTYGAGGWTCWWSTGLEDDILATTSGTVSAVYVPFVQLNNTARPVDLYTLEFLDASGAVTTEFIAAHRIYSFYMAAEGAAYTVSGDTFSATLNMQVPARENFAHFFIPDLTETTPRRYILTEESGQLVGLSVTGYDMAHDKFTTTLNPDGVIYGYPTGTGYSFSCNIDPALLGVSYDYTFTLTDTKGTASTADDLTYRLTVPGKSLSRGKAAVLPTLESGRWISEYDAVPMFEDGDGNIICFADRNLGATATYGEDSYGLLFAWGETVGHTRASVGTSYYFKLSDCPYYTGTVGGYDQYAKYVPTDKTDNWGGAGSPDNLLVLQPVDDAATAALGAGWRMPTIDEWMTLLGWPSNPLERCSWDSTKKVWVVQGIGAYSANTIYIPETGWNSGTTISNVDIEGHYWSSSLKTSDPVWAYDASFYHTDGVPISRGSTRRNYGHPIRAIKVITP